MKKYLVLLAFIIIQNSLFAQNKHEFVRIENKKIISNNPALDFFPLDKNNFWEYTESGFFNPQIRKVTLVKDVQTDTLLSTGYMYTKIISYFYSNRLTDTISIDYYRKDITGNVYMFNENKDKLIYDFHKEIDAVYPSPWTGYDWKIADKYSVEFMGDTLMAVKLFLLNPSGNIVYTETFCEKFGSVFAYGNKPFSTYETKMDFWGCVVRDTVYGDLLAKYQKINWNDYYPLEIGNFWKYSDSEQGITFNRVVEVLSDSLLNDGYLYKRVLSTTNGPFPYPSYSWERIDSLGNMFEWYGNNDIPKFMFRFSACIADTFSFPNQFGFWSIDKAFLGDGPAIILESQSIVYAEKCYSKGIGLSSYAYEGNLGGHLVGYIINGVHWGDTSPLGVEDGVNKQITYSISQNYPNPFNPATTISYQLPKNGQVTIKVYDMLGREVRTLVNENKPAGRYNVNFDAGSLSSGVYIYRIVAGDYTAAKKMTLIK